MTPLDYIRHAVNLLAPSLGKGEARAVAELLFHRYKGWSRTDILVNDDKELSAETVALLDAALQRILAGEPVQYVTGEAYFYGLWLKVDPRVLIPRPETAALVDIIVDRAAGRPDLDVLDLATGSGCIAIALARTLPFARVEAVDISDGALRVATANARSLGVKVKFIEADLLKWEPQPDSFDIIVSNPPYIGLSERAAMEPTVKDYEPAEALFVPDAYPLLFYKPIAHMAARALRPGGALYLEINPLHAAAVAALLADAGLTGVETRPDMYGRIRYAIAMKPAHD